MAKVDPHSYADPEQGRVTRLGLILDVDFRTKRLTGTATLGLEGAKGGHLDLDTRDLDISGVMGPDGKCLDWEMDPADPVLGSRLRVHLPDGTGNFVVEFATSPEASALQWLEPAQTDGGKHPYLFSQCQAIHARSVIPCQDSPLARLVQLMGTTLASRHDHPPCIPSSHACPVGAAERSMPAIRRGGISFKVGVANGQR